MRIEPPLNSQFAKGTDLPGQNDGKPVSLVANYTAPLAFLWCLILVLAGSALLCVANESLDPFFVAVLFLLIGAPFVALFSGARIYELRAFLLTYGVCVLVTGMAQYYSSVVFGELQSFKDAIRYLAFVPEGPPYWTKEQLLGQLDAVYAILAWQRVYTFVMDLGLQYGLYIGVLFNSLLVGFSAAVTVRAARELFGDDAWRLRRVGTLFSLCGIFWLFGAILVRDCFTLFLNTLVFWVLVRWLVSPKFKNLLLAAVVTGLSSYAMWYMRPRSVVLFGIFVCLALFCWYWRTAMNPTRIVATMLIPIVLLFAFVYLQQFGLLTAGFASREMASYEDISEQGASGDSLGLALVNRQPLPIRIVLGSGRMMVDPIPIWAYLEPGVDEYHLLKTYNGVFSMILMPLVFVGFMMTMWEARKFTQGLSPRFFVGAYSLMTLFAVAAISLETRHLGQFAPAVLILAAIPDTREESDRKHVQSTAALWFAVVFLAYVAWAVMKSR